MKCSPITLATGIALGAGAGTALGVALGHVGPWIAIGIGVGVAIALACVPKSKADENPARPRFRRN